MTGYVVYGGRSICGAVACQLGKDTGPLLLATTRQCALLTVFDLAANRLEMVDYANAKYYAQLQRYPFLTTYLNPLP